jgi:hypothetical protein
LSIINPGRADPVDGITGETEDQERDEEIGWSDHQLYVDKFLGVICPVEEAEWPCEVVVAYRAGREDAAREMAQKIIDHANRYAPLDGNIQQRRMRRHLMIAVQVVSPKPSLEEIAAAVARGDYVACHLDEYGQPVDQPGVQPTEEQRARDEDQKRYEEE